MLIQPQEIQQVANAMMNLLREGELEIINALHDAIKAKDIDAIDTQYKALVTELDTNFKTEEEMMEAAAYPDAGMHKSDHDLIRKKLDKFLKRWEVLKGPKELQGFLEKDFKKWYTQHIAKWDGQAAPHLV